jgi:hypothetical protein
VSLISYPAFLQPRTYSAQQVRHLYDQLVPREGIVGRGDFTVSQRAAGANMSVDVAAGEAFVQGDTSARQGIYHLTNDAVANVAVPAANGTNPRVDLLVARVNDSTVVGSSDTPALEIVQGTPTSGATLANLTNAPGQPGGPAIPATALPLAFILVPAAATSIVDANIGYLAKSDSSTAPAIAGAPPFYAFLYPWGLGSPSVRVRRNSNQSIPDGTETVITGLNTESADLNQLHDTAVNDERITIKVPGYYRVAGMVSFDANNAGFRRLQLYLNGATVIGAVVANAAPAGISHAMNVSTMFRFSYGDYIDLRAQQNSGGALNVLGGGENSPVIEVSWQGR